MIIGIHRCWTNTLERLEARGDLADWFLPFLRKADTTLNFEAYHAHKDDLSTDVIALESLDAPLDDLAVANWMISFVNAFNKTDIQAA